MAQNEAKIVFKTEAELKAGRDLLKQLQEIEYKVDVVQKKYSKYFGEQEAGQNMLGIEFEKTKNALAKNVAAHTDATKAGEAHLSVSGKLLKSFKSLGNEVPIVGVALRALSNPWTLLATAAVSAAVAVKRVTDAAKEAAAALDPFEKLSAAFGRWRTLTAEMAGKRNTFLDELDQIATKSDTASQRLTKVNDQITKRMQLEGRGDEVAKAEQFTGLDRLVSEGKLTPRQAAEQKVLLEGMYARKATQREQGAAEARAVATEQARLEASQSAERLRSEALAMEPAEQSARKRVSVAERRAELESEFTGKRIAPIKEKIFSQREKIRDMAARGEPTAMERIQLERMETDLSQEMDQADKARAVADYERANLGAVTGQRGRLQSQAAAALSESISLGTQSGAALETMESGAAFNRATGGQVFAAEQNRMAVIGIEDDKRRAAEAERALLESHRMVESLLQSIGAVSSSTQETVRRLEGKVKMLENNSQYGPESQ